MNKWILTTKTVFDTSKLRLGSRIEVIDDTKDLVRYSAVVVGVGLDKIEYVYTNPETGGLRTGRLSLDELSSGTRDGYTVKLLKCST